MSGETIIKPNILYVDDLKTNLVLFKATFEKDYQIFITESAEEALNILRKEKIQVLVTDQRMPGISGTELLEIVSREFPDVRRFLLTAYTDFETVVEAVNKGHIHGYINKPIQADDVRNSIKNSLEVYYLREKNRQILSDLEKANQELSELDGIKTGILKIMSREIRTPLNRIMGTIHLLKDKIESEELIQVINVLDASVSRLEQFSIMAEQISALKSGERKLKLEETSLKKLVELAMVEMSDRIREKGIKVDIQCNEELNVMADFELLISCFVSIMDHAIQHTGPSEIISVITGRENDKIYIEINDTGKDYSEKRLEELQQHFNRKSGMLDLSFGIELSLAQLIMELHKGEIGFLVKNKNTVAIQMAFGR
jgi:signal transduction histidine kinase